jgi:adenylate kinase family enzyme
MGALTLKCVLIVGCPGAGKSTAARALSEITGLPVIHLDRLYWQPGWRMPDGDVWRATVEALAAEPRWIMDGNYSGTLVSRLTQADTLIHLDYPTGLCLWRVLRRTTLGWGRVRADTGQGCPERFNAEFLRFVVNYRRDQRARDMARMADFAGEVHRFTGPTELAAFIARCRTFTAANAAGEFILGAACYEKIAAVEGVELTLAMKQRFRDATKTNASPDEYRNTIIDAHRKP